jgi:hypothetical protein
MIDGASAFAEGQPFDLTPDPRVLAVLGEINLDQWRCLAELVDNCLDNFISLQRAGESLDDPTVWITIPTADAAAGRVTVRDNGSGMPPAVLETAVRAGWSGNDPIGNLGLFGMGFNIATARLGSRTTVWTTQSGDPEWIGLEIDFDVLKRQRHFLTPRLHRPKADPDDHGTEITVQGLKPEQRQWFARPANRSAIGRELGRAYSAMLRPTGIPIHFKLLLNGNAVPRRDHATWSAERYVDRPGTGPVFGVEQVRAELAPRPYCKRCWLWLGATDDICPECGEGDQVVRRSRVIHGWVGVQRYLSNTDYGIDFLRHGRKIEMGNRELFQWQTESGALEPEYPIDDPRNRGRLVGEIHLDHCRVTYTKDRFDRNDPAWTEMVEAVRGQGPLRPDKAQEIGAPPNTSPLYRLFQAYRRSSPRPKVAGCYAKLLLVPDNDRATELARKFYEGDAAYQSDDAWWALVEAGDNALLTQTPGGAEGGGGGARGGAAEAGSDGIDFGATSQGSGTGTTVEAAPATLTTTRRPLPALTRESRDEVSNTRFDVRAFDAEERDPGLGGAPLASRRLPTGEWEVLINTRDRLFRSATMTPLDALLGELAWRVVDFTRGQQNSPTHAVVLASLRGRYARAHELDPVTLGAEARQTMTSIARAIAGNVTGQDARALFDELSTPEREAIQARMAARDVRNRDAVIGEGRFLEFASSTTIRRFVAEHPELFFDGRYWDDAYEDTGFDLPHVIAEARGRLVSYYTGLISDAAWLADQEPADLEDASRERLLRASLALQLLEPTGRESREVAV